MLTKDKERILREQAKLIADRYIAPSKEMKRRAKLDLFVEVKLGQPRRVMDADEIPTSGRRGPTQRGI